VQPSVIKLGLTDAWEVAQSTWDTPVTFAPQVAFFGPGYLAALHMLAASRTEASLERLYVELQHTPYAQSVPIVDGRVYVPQGAGLGADPEDSLISRSLN
jgi:L-alanine-DL-glutamate epimerase-like enolase superfamily enzyme